MTERFTNFRKLDGCVVVYTDNYLNDIEGAELEDACDSFLKEGKKKIIIDFANTELINSLGISILIGIMEKIRDNKGVLFFSGLKNVNYDIFEMLGITDHVPIFKTEEDALSKIMNHK